VVKMPKKKQTRQRKPKYITGPHSRPLDSLVEGDLIELSLCRKGRSVSSEYFCVYEGQINTNFKTYHGKRKVDSRFRKKGFAFLNLSDYLKGNKIESIRISTEQAHFFSDGQLLFYNGVSLEDERKGLGYNFAIRIYTEKDIPKFSKRKLELLNIGKKLLDKYVYPPDTEEPTKLFGWMRDEIV